MQFHVGIHMLLWNNYNKTRKEYAIWLKIIVSLDPIQRGRQYFLNRFFIIIILIIEFYNFTILLY